MPPDIPENRQAISRSRAVEVIERTQKDALRKLRPSGLPEAHALLVMQRISAFCLQTLRELDVLYREFEELVAMEPGRSEARQTWLNDKAATLLLQVEAGIAEIVATTIRQAIHDLQHQPSPPQDVLPLPTKPSRPGWLAFLLTAPRLLVWLTGMAAWLLMGWQATGGSVFLTGLAMLFPLVLWRFVGSYWWAVILPLGAVGLLYWRDVAMSSHDWTLPPRYPLCVFSDSYYRTGQAIVSSLNGATPEMFAAAQESL
jgi:hypothetical protein